MSKKIKVGVVGGSGYTGGELLRILYGHPFVDIVGVTSRKYLGKPISRTHPNLRKISKLKFISIESMPDVDVLFLGLPHHAVMDYIDDFLKKTDLLIDLSSDFRLSNPDDYIKYYGHEHSRPELLKEFVYGMPELHREKIINSKFIAVPGCTATAAILPCLLYTSPSPRD